MHYCVSLLAYQSPLNLPHKSHCFAVFSPNFHTISWLPVNDKVSFFRWKELGKNLTLPETFKYAVERNAEVYHTGTFRIKYELYKKGLQQIERLESGKTMYQILGNSMETCNCIQAISNVVGPLKTGMTWGVRANALILNHFRPWLLLHT